MFAAALGLGEVAAELALEHAVHALDLLLLAQLQPKSLVREPLVLAVLTSLLSNLALSPIGAAQLRR